MTPVNDPPVAATGGFSFTVAEGTAVVSGTVASFTDAGNPGGTVEDAADYSAVINWGDGSSSTGAAVTITNSGGTFLVTGLIDASKTSMTFSGDVNHESSGYNCIGFIVDSLLFEGLVGMEAARRA